MRVRFRLLTGCVNGTRGWRGREVWGRVRGVFDGSGKMVWVPFEAVSLDHIMQLIGECSDAMVFFLVLDVSDQRRAAVEVGCEGAIAFLPVFECGEYAMAFDPVGGGGFDGSDQVRQCEGRVEGCEDMKVIFDPSNAVEVAAMVCENAGDELEEVVAPRFVECAHPVLGAEDDVVSDVGVGWHLVCNGAANAGIHNCFVVGVPRDRKSVV